MITIYKNYKAFFCVFQSILVGVRSQILSDPNAALDTTNPNLEYHLSDAKAAFQRMKSKYGWS